MNDKKELALFEVNELEAVLLDKKMAMSILDHVKQQVGNPIFDVSTKKGRDEVKATMTKVVKSRKAVEKAKMDLTRELKAKPKLVDENWRSIKEGFEEFETELRAPLTEYEEAEKAKAEAEAQAAVDAAMKIQVENDHEVGLLFNEKFDAEKLAAAEKAEQERLAYERRIKEQAETNAKIAAQKIIDDAAAKVKRDAEMAAAEEAQAEAAELARAQNVEHQRTVNNQAVNFVIEVLGAEVTIDQAQRLVKAIAQGKSGVLSINY